VEFRSRCRCSSSTAKDAEKDRERYSRRERKSEMGGRMVYRFRIALVENGVS